MSDWIERRRKKVLEQYRRAKATFKGWGGQSVFIYLHGWRG